MKLGLEVNTNMMNSFYLQFDFNIWIFVVEILELLLIFGSLCDFFLTENFDGMKCDKDEHCEEWNGVCSMSTKRCQIKSTDEVERDFLTCYINSMDTSLEDYLL